MRTNFLWQQKPEWTHKKICDRSKGSMRQEMSQTDNPGQNTGNVKHQITLPRETRCHIHTSHASLLLWAQEAVTFPSKYLNVFSLLFCSDFPRMQFLCLQCSNLLRASGESHCPESQSALVSWLLIGQYSKYSPLIGRDLLTSDCMALLIKP